MKRSNIHNLVKTSLMTVVITLCSWITIPFPIPFTLQTFGVYCSLLLLGGKLGTASVLLYILLGTMGLPVFSGFSSGLGHLMSPVGGYVWGFVLCAILYLCTEKITYKNYKRKSAVLSLGTILCYTAGTLWFVFSLGSCTSLWQVLSLCVLPFVIPDAIKIVFAVLISKKITPIINKNFKG